MHVYASHLLDSQWDTQRGFCLCKLLFPFAIPNKLSSPVNERKIFFIGRVGTEQLFFNTKTSVTVTKVRVPWTRTQCTDIRFLRKFSWFMMISCNFCIFDTLVDLSCSFVVFYLVLRARARACVCVTGPFRSVVYISHSYCGFGPGEILSYHGKQRYGLET